MNHRSSDLLDSTSHLDLTDVTDPVERLILTMDTMIEWQRVEALGWWEHTSDWDLEITVILRDGTRHDLLGEPEFSLTIEGKNYATWDLIKDPTVVPIHYQHGVEGIKDPSVEIVFANALMYADEGNGNDDGEEVTMTFNLADVKEVIHNR